MTPSLSTHLCTAIGCKRTVPKRLLMCAPHWNMVPGALQQAVLTTWRRGPSVEWLAARTAAIEAVALAEHGRPGQRSVCVRG